MGFDLYGDLVPGELAKASELNDKFDLIEGAMNDLGGLPNGTHGVIGNNAIGELQLQDNAITQDKVLLTDLAPVSDFDIAPKGYVDQSLDDNLNDAFQNMFTNLVGSSDSNTNDLRTALTVLPTQAGSEDNYYFNYTTYKSTSSGYLTIILAENQRHWVTLLVDSLFGASPSTNFLDARYGIDYEDFVGIVDPEVYVREHFAFGNDLSLFTMKLLIPKDIYFKVHVSDRSNLKNGENNTGNSQHITQPDKFGAERILKVLWQPLFTTGDLLTQ